jgi:hypothetical protein
MLRRIVVSLAVLGLAYLVVPGCTRTNEISGKNVSKAVGTNDPVDRFISEDLSYKAVLPKDAKNIQDIGNGWLTFDLEVAGKKRTFMYARSRTYGSYAVPVCTELSDPIGGEKR